MNQLLIVDWNDSETDLAHLGGAQPGAAKSGGDKLWEDNWDDDDIEDEFSVQLRYKSFHHVVLSRLLITIEYQERIGQDERVWQRDSYGALACLCSVIMILRTCPYIS